MGNALTFGLRSRKGAARWISASAWWPSAAADIDEGLAQDVADGIGLTELPDKVAWSNCPITTCEEAPRCTILKNGPDVFEGRKLGDLYCRGTPMRAS